MDEQDYNGKDDELFDALLKSAAFDALEKEIDELPSCEELNKEYKTSNELNAKITEMLQESLTKAKRRKRRSNRLRLIAGLMIVFVMSIGVMFCFEPSRNLILNTCLAIRFKYYQNSIPENDLSENHIGEYYLPTYIPEGFEETRCSADPTPKNAYIDINYTNQEEQVISYHQGSPLESMAYDTRYATCYEVDINGVSAHLFVTTHEHHAHDLFWQTEDLYFSFSCPLDIDPEELIRMAESLKK